jgi:hydroxymethylglutaryl-CoA reductase
MTPKENTSRIPGFYSLPLNERRAAILRHSQLSEKELADLTGEAGLDADQANHMIENVIGLHSLPLGIAQNFVINDRQVLVPMAIEEPSVVAGASFMAKLVRSGGGFSAKTSPPEMIGQMQILNLADLDAAQDALLAEKQHLLSEAGKVDPVLQELGGGPRDIEVRQFADSPVGPFLVLHLIYDVRDAMGANAVNTAVEWLTPLVESITGGQVHLRILSNLADRRLARADCTVPLSELAFGSYTGAEVRQQPRTTRAS